MTTTDSKSPSLPRPTREPVAGPRFRDACKAGIGGKPGKLLLLLAAYADAGEGSPAARELAHRLGINVERIDPLLKTLIAERVLYVRWRAEPETQRNVYELRLRRPTRGASALRRRPAETERRRRRE